MASQLGRPQPKRAFGASTGPRRELLRANGPRASPAKNFGQPACEARLRIPELEKAQGETLHRLAAEKSAAPRDQLCAFILLFSFCFVFS